MNQISTLDMNHQDFNQHLCDTCHEIGFFYLKNHDIAAPFFFEPNLSAVVTPMPIFNKPVINSDINVIYGEHMLNVFKRSFNK